MYQKGIKLPDRATEPESSATDQSELRREMGQLEGRGREQRGDSRGEPPLQASTGFRSGFRSGFGFGDGAE